MHYKNQGKLLNEAFFYSNVKYLSSRIKSILPICLLFCLIGTFSINHISAQNQIVVGSGTGSGTFTPVASWYNSSATESIYLGSEIGYQGEITHLAFDKASGNSNTPVEVKIYMRSTNQLNLGQSDYIISSIQTQDYELVYSGTIPNNSTTGWMEVALDNVFSFNGAISNLAVVVEGFTCIPQGRPQYRYTTTSPNRMSSTYDDGSIGCDGNNPWSFGSTLEPKLERPNIRLIFNSSPISSIESVNNDDIIISNVHGEIIVNAIQSIIREVELYDITGRILYKSQEQLDRLNINCSAFESGVLLIRVRTDNNQPTIYKVVVQ